MNLHSEVRSIVDHYEFAMRDCPTPCPDGPWIVLKRLFAALNELLAAAPKPEPAEPAQDDDYRSLDHACEILRGCVAPYSGEQAYAVAKALKQWRDKWAAAVDCIHPDERQTIADLRAALTASQMARIAELGKGGA